MSKLNGRKPVDLKLPDLKNGYIPIYDGIDRLWTTVDYATLVSSSANLSGSNVFTGDQVISGSLIVTNNVTASFFTGTFVGDGSNLYNISASAVNGLQLNQITDGPATASITSGSGLRINTNTEITGSLIISGSVTIRENLTVLGSSSIVYATASQLEVLSNIIYLNAYSPAFRFAGISAYDSGSVGKTGSLFWDSENDVWLYQNPDAGGYTSARLISGPQNTGSLGNETALTVNKIQKAVGDDHIGDSNITDDGTVVRIESNTEITGGLKISGSINIGNYLTVNQSITGAVRITGSLLLNGSEVGTGKLDENQFNQFTASYKTGSFTGSFIGDGSGLYNLPISGITGLNLNEITGSLNVSGSVTASFFVGDGSHLTNLPAAANVLRISGSAGDNTIVNLLSSSLYITGSGLVTASLSDGGITINVPFLLNQYDGITKKYTQSTPATTWTFIHNLGERYPAIQVFDSNGYVVVPTNIQSVNTNTLVVSFSSAQSGTVTATVGGGLPAISASYNGYMLRTDGVIPQWEPLGSLPFATTGSNQFVGDQTITGSVKIKNAKMDATCSVMSTSGTVISATGYDGANFDYVVKSGANMRLGNIMAVWSGTSVKYSETSTTDLGNTSDVTFTVSNTGDLNANITSGTWTVEVLYRALGCL
jgi:hypothetical protein